MTRLLACDPGLDVTGVAVFRLDGWHPREPWADVLGRLERAEPIRTAPTEPLPVRLARLGERLVEIMGEMGVSRVVVEVPATHSAYVRLRQQQRTKGTINGIPLAKLGYAIGALMSGAARAIGAEAVIAQKASTRPKLTRITEVKVELARRGHPLGLARRPSPDVLDAVSLGALYLTDPQRWQEGAA